MKGSKDAGPTVDLCASASIAIPEPDCHRREVHTADFERKLRGSPPKLETLVGTSIGLKLSSTDVVGAFRTTDSPMSDSPSQVR